MTTTDDETPAPRSFYEAMKEAGAIGCVTDAPADLSTNPVHMEGFGRPRGREQPDTKENEMTTLTIDETAYSKAAHKAEADGMSVERWLEELIDRSVPDPETPTPEERVRKFRAFLGTVESWNPRYGRQPREHVPGAAVRTLLDTNVLLRLAEGTGTRTTRPPATPWKRCSLAGEELVIVPQNVYEFWAVATRTREANGLEMPVPKVRGHVDDFRDMFPVLADRPGAAGRVAEARGPATRWRGRTPTTRDSPRR